MSEELQQIFNCAPCAISYIDREMRVIRLNPLMEALVGLKSEEARGRHCYDCWGQYAGDSSRQGREKICDTCQVPATLVDGRQRFYERKIGLKIFEISTNPVYANNDIIGTMEVGLDITARKTAEAKQAYNHEQLQRLTARLIEVEETERRQIARQLHDEIGQQLTVLGLNLHMLGQNGQPEQRRRIDDSLDLVASMTRQVRDIMADLRPPVLDDYGLRAALRWYGPIFTSRTGIGVIILARIPRLPAHLEITLFRITQEALNNVLKHAKATEVEIYCALDNKLLSLAVHDNGCGMQQLSNHVSAKAQTWGLLSMRERIESFGGRLIITPRPGGGTIIKVEVEI